MTTQRARFEQEARSLLRVPRPIRLTRLQTTYSEIVSALTGEMLVMELWVANVDSSARTFSVSLVPNGGSAGSANAVVFQMSIAANNAMFVPAIGSGGLLVEPGYTLEAACSSNNTVNIGGWGFEYTGRYD